LANGGTKFQPKLVLETQDAVSRIKTLAAVQPPQPLGYKPEHIEVVHKGLHGVTTEGTSARVFAGAGYSSGGKTGTAQAVTIGQKDKYDAKKIDEHQRDHALYMAFAPLQKPTIALAIVVENAGFGAEHAAPIARRVFDYYLENKYPNDEDMAAAQLGKAAAPIGKPLSANDVKFFSK
jgi:penicillin-binding protein 2